MPPPRLLGAPASLHGGSCCARVTETSARMLRGGPSACVHSLQRLPAPAAGWPSKGAQKLRGPGPVQAGAAEVRARPPHRRPSLQSGGRRSPAQPSPSGRAGPASSRALRLRGRPLPSPQRPCSPPLQQSWPNSWPASGQMRPGRSSGAACRSYSTVRPPPAAGCRLGLFGHVCLHRAPAAGAAGAADLVTVAPRVQARPARVAARRPAPHPAAPGGACRSQLPCMHFCGLPARPPLQRPAS